MKTSWKIFLRDLNRLKKNVIAIVVIAGVCIIPSLYAWFNLYANMDPYANTGRLPIAVVNQDKGADDERIGHLDAGGKTMEKLRDNDKMGWVFTDEEQAVEGVKSGEYYAAIVIPETFSEDIVSIFSTDIHQPQLIFYSNEKKNAIAPKITETGASTIQQGINEEFVAQVSEVITSIIKDSFGEVDRELSDSMKDLEMRIENISKKTEAYQALLADFGDLRTETDTVISDGKDMLDEARGIVRKAEQSGDNLDSKINDAWRKYNDFSNDLRDGVNDANIKLSDFNAVLGEKIGDINGRIRELNQEFNRSTDPIVDRAYTILRLNSELIDLLAELDASLADSDVVQAVLTDLAEDNARHEQILSLLESLSDGAQNLYTYSSGTYPTLRNSVSDGQSNLLSALNTIDNTVTSDAGMLFSRASTANGYLQGLLQNAEEDIDSVETLLDTIGDSIENVDGTLSTTEDTLTMVRDEISQAADDVKAIENMQIFADLRDISSAVDSVSTGQFISSPVTTETEVLYPVANYGTGMTPFFTNLAIWVGCIILVNIFKTDVDEDDKLKGFTMTQSYFGRWLLFAVASLIQAFIICLGDMLLLGVHVEHPVLFILCGLWASFIYMNIIYALVTTFKNVGKALSVLIVIWQLPGSSGTYPIEMVPEFFQKIHPFLPFKYGITAMREALAGLYKNDYIKNLGMLLYFLAAALLIGLIIRPLLAEFNHRFDRKMYDTDLMAYEDHYPPRNEQYVFHGPGHIIKIFVDDLKHIAKNAIVLVIVFGLAVVPCMYSFFNIAASWAPYDNVDKLKVAVANNDEGYQSSLLPAKINIGEKIMAALQNNNNLDWVLTDGEDAVEGTRSGEYYAAIVVSEDFSRNMMSLFSGEDVNPVIRYYSNQKKNAVSPKVTDKASTALQQQIDEAFAETASGALISVINTISAFQDDEHAQSMVGELNNRMDKIEGNLLYASETVDAYTDMVGSLMDLIAITSQSLEHTNSGDEASRQMFNDAAEDITQLSSSFDDISGAIESVLNNSMTIYGNVDSQIADSFNALESDRIYISDNLIGTADQVQVLIDRYTGWRDSLEELANTLENSDGIGIEIVEEAEVEIGDAVSLSEVETIEAEIQNERIRAQVIRQLQKVISKMDEFIDKQNNLYDKLVYAVEQLNNLNSDIVTIHSDLSSKIDDCYRSLSNLNVEFDDRLKTVMNTLSDKITESGNDTLNFKNLLYKTMDDSQKMMNSAQDSLSELQVLLSDTSGELQAASQDLEDCINDVKETVDSEDLKQVERLLAQDPDLLASLWASPVKLETVPVYKIDNYGSAMAPFYTALSIWVGGTIMVAMIKVNVSDEKKKALGKDRKVTHTEMYFGRLLIFFVIGFIQSSIVGLVDLNVLGVQCSNPFLFMLTCWVSSFIFVMIIYTLTISFGDAGKAIAVVLMVIQVAGSGGTFPIDLAPDVFRNMYPLLPFVHTMDALRECIAGMYRNDYWIEIGKLFMYLIPVLILGLVLRRPVVNLNKYIEEKLEEVKFI